MALVMTSLILVQINSIYQALGIKEEQFDAAVKSALNQVVLRLENAELVQSKEIGKQFFAPQDNDVFPRNSFNQKASRQSLQLSLQYKQRVGSNSYSEELIIDYDTPPSQVVNERGLPGDYPNAFDIIDDQEGYVRQQYEDQIQQKTKWLTLIEEYAIIFSRMDIQDRIDAQRLERLIKTELKNSGITLDYKYAVKTFQRGEERDIIGGKNYNPGPQKEYPVLLFPHDPDETKKPRRPGMT